MYCILQNGMEEARLSYLRTDLDGENNMIDFTPKLYT
jgi:hypothetical protein